MSDYSASVEPKADITMRWIATDMLSPHQLEALVSVLSTDETTQASQLSVNADRRSFAAAHALTRIMISEMARGAPSSWRFERNAYGKPKLSSHQGYPDIRINLSHTRGLAVAAAAFSRDLGVDAEWLGRPAPLEVGEDQFAESERAFLNAQPAEHRHAVFFSLWTLKEAYVKARGLGMSLPFCSFAISLEPLCLIESDDDCLERWGFRQVVIEPEHLIALAFQVDTPQAPYIDAAPADLDRLTKIAEASGDDRFY